MADTCYPNTQKTEAGALLGVGAQPELYSSRLGCATEQEWFQRTKEKQLILKENCIYKRNQANNRFPKVKTPGGSFVSSSDVPQQREKSPIFQKQKQKEHFLLSVWDHH